MRNLIYFLLFAIYSCNSVNDYDLEINKIVLNDFLATSSEYFPINNIKFLEAIKKHKFLDECNINIDSIKLLNSTLKNFDPYYISNYKIKSIYLNALVECYSKDELQINLIYSNELSLWANDIILKYDSVFSPIKIDKTYNVDLVRGWPFTFKNYSTIESFKEKNQIAINEECVKYLKISSIYKTVDILFVEITYGCTNRDENKIVYILREYFGKWIIDDKINSDYKY